MNKLLLFLSAMVLLFSYCKNKSQEPVDSVSDEDDWIVLFDGSSLDHWKGWKKDSVAAAWQIEDNVLVFNPEIEGRGDIITREQFENFELHLDWKIEDCGNSGIMYNVQESEEYDHPYSTGPEMQILDNKCHPDGRIEKHRAGDLYDMIKTSVVNVKPAGEWNSIILISNNAHVEFWQNDTKVVEFEMHTDTWAETIANSKFKDWKGFGTYKKGSIAIQDHGDKVWFRDIRIKSL